MNFKKRFALTKVKYMIFTLLKFHKDSLSSFEVINS